ncbi:hypothetical protein FE257_007214 [Aspergillus nanangensis]|uniref:Dihydromonacolin L monooxygenase LovA n=1 Tax=Aspergillus nanangensis TaxID=2582783 RepID=A0AAD4CMZ1_ASPNN|nr:hypothetical protein FE257_007214 [Aspergillus nanangensis]
MAIVDILANVSELDPIRLACGSICLGLLAVLVYSSLNTSPFPVVNQKQGFEIKSSSAKRRFLSNAYNLIKSGLAKSNVFWIISDNGPKLALSPKYANEIRSHAALSFGGSIAREFHSNIRGFEPFKQGTTGDEIFQDAVRMRLTQSLGHVTQPLSEETQVALKAAWTDSEDWHDIALRSNILGLVAQLSSKVFLGDKICQNPDWLKITVDYTVDSFIAAQELRLWPWFLRPIMANFLPSCQKIRKELQQAKGIIDPVLEERRVTRQRAIDQGKTPERYVDALQWMEESAKGRPYDAAVAQISFSLAAIHTTSDMLSQVLLDLCDMPDVVSALRGEVITVIQEEGWKKTTLYKLKLMDSVLKESQRLKPIGIGTMRRLAAQNIGLSDGTVIPKGASVFVSCERMWDPKIYPAPEKFDAYRFLKLRETAGHETSAQSVSPSPEHMGFGLGKHACPGRFFAINEVKIALCHILLKYDFKLAEGYTPKPRKNGLSLNSDPFARISPFLYYPGLSIYNLYFHPLSKYPGPRLAAATPWWICLSYFQGNTPRKLLELHNRYGPIVRTSPDELSFIKPLQWKEIYGHKSSGEQQLTKDKKYHTGLGTVQNILNADRHYHAYIRKLMANGFSEKALREQEPILQKNIDLLVQRMHEVGQNGTAPVDVISWYNFVTFDFIGYLTFGESFDCLANSRIHQWIKVFFSLVRLMAFGQAIARLPYLLQLPATLWLIPKSVKSDAATHNQLNTVGSLSIPSTS